MKPSESTSSDVGIINALIYGTTCEALINALGHETPCMTWELLDIATSMPP